MRSVACLTSGGTSDQTNATRMASVTAKMMPTASDRLTPRRIRNRTAGSRLTAMNSAMMTCTSTARTV